MLLFHDIIQSSQCINILFVQSNFLCQEVYSHVLMNNHNIIQILSDLQTFHKKCSRIYFMTCNLQWNCISFCFALFRYRKAGRRLRRDWICLLCVFGHYFHFTKILLFNLWKVLLSEVILYKVDHYSVTLIRYLQHVLYVSLILKSNIIFNDPTLLLHFPSMDKSNFISPWNQRTTQCYFTYSSTIIRYFVFLDLKYNFAIHFLNQNNFKSRRAIRGLSQLVTARKSSYHLNCFGET